MNRIEIIERLTPIFRKVFSRPDLELSETMCANDVETWTSLTHMTMIVMVEEAFNIEFKLRDIKKMKQVGDLIDIILSKIS